MKHVRPDYDRVLKQTTEALIKVGQWMAALIMIALLATGMWEIVLGITGLLAAHGSGKGAVAKVLEGIELMFLAPTPLLVLLSLKKHLRSVITEQVEQHGPSGMVEVKAFLVSLMTAVIATDLIAQTYDGQLNYESALTRCIAIAVLGGYFVILERLSRHQARFPSAPGLES